MEIDNSDIRVDCFCRFLKRVLRCLCCCGPENYEIQLSVEETAPSAERSTVRPWFEECNKDENYLSHQFRRNGPK